MNFEPDAIILPRLIPWLEKSKLRMTIFGILVFIAGIIIIFIWLTHFFIPVFAWSTIFGLLFIYIALTQLDGDKKDNSLTIKN
jgi:hypothetical protein